MAQRHTTRQASLETTDLLFPDDSTDELDYYYDPTPTTTYQLQRAMERVWRGDWK